MLAQTMAMNMPGRLGWWATACHAGGMLVATASAQQCGRLEVLEWPDTRSVRVVGTSADADIIGGDLWYGGSRSLFRWTHSSRTLELLPGAYYATAVSADGSTIVANMQSLEPVRAMRWINASRVEEIIGPVGTAAIYTTAVSADGNTVTGLWRTTTSQWRLLVWTAELGHRDGGSLGGELYEPVAVSADGNAVIGAALDAHGEQRAYRWTLGTGLVPLTEPGEQGWAAAVSSDGSVVVGSMYDANSNSGFRWSSTGGLEQLSISSAAAVSPNGLVISGYAVSPAWPDPPRKWAFRWTRESGAQDVGGIREWNTLFLDAKLAADTHAGLVIAEFEDIPKAYRWTVAGGLHPLTDAYRYQEVNAAAISRDGSVVVGTVWSDTVRAARWTFGPSDFIADDSLDFFDVAAFLECFEGALCPPGRSADFNSDGFIDATDVSDFIDAFVIGC